MSMQPLTVNDHVHQVPSSLSRGSFSMVLIVSFVSGCGPIEPQEVADLQELGLAYHYYTEGHNAPPEGWDDLLRQEGVDAATVEQLSNAGLVVNWGSTLRDATSGACNFVLAYPEHALDSGGHVVMLGGEVYQMTPEELKRRLASQAAQRPRGKPTQPTKSK